MLNLIKATQREQGIQNLVIVGDINFSCTNWKSLSSKCEYEQSILDNFQELNLEQFIITDTGKSLDILLCNNPDIILDVYMDNRLKNDFTSDQPPYGSKLHMNHKLNQERVPLPSQKYDFSGFAFKKANWNEINEYVREHHFNPYCYSNVDLLVDQWYNWIYGIIIKHIPRTTQHRKHLAPWISPTSSNLMKKVETLRRQSKTNTLKIQQLQTELSLSLSADQCNLETEIVMSGIFSNVQKYLKTIMKTSSIPTEVFLDDRSANTDIEEAELFNQYFQSVFSKNHHDYTLTEGQPKLSMIHFSELEIQLVLQSLDESKAKGLDRMGNNLLKKLSDSLPKSLHLIFNTIANKCYFPSFWKTSEIIPIFKEGNKQMVDNYRPISLLVAVSKVLEKLIFDKMYPILSTALFQSQHGFRQRRSSITNLIEYLHKMFVNFDNSNCHFLASFYLDFQKAFDKVNTI